jgi:hypothetical protein
MSPGIIILLGRGLWTRDAGAWRRESFEAGPAGRDAQFVRLEEILSGAPPRRWILVFEPEAFGHQTVETPKVSRSVFASLAKVRSEFPVVESDILGWGIEFPEAVQGGTYTTLLHAELTPGLALLREACSRMGSRLEAAWPAYTAAVACVQSSVPAARARFLLILAHDFAAVATCVAGKRTFKAWVGPMSERDWKALSALIGDADTRLSSSMADPGMRRASIAVIAEGEPSKLCPWWDEIHASGRVAAVMKMDALAEGVARIPKNHPANLVEAFPVPLDLNRCLAGATLAGLVAALLLGALVIRARGQLRREGESIDAQAAALEGRLEALSRNRDEMNRLRGEAPPDAGSVGVSRHEALVRLSAAIPDSVTLTSLSIRRDNGLEIEAMIVGPGFDSEALRHSLEKLGIVLSQVEGWAFNAAAGRLVIRGKLGAPRT